MSVPIKTVRCLLLDASSNDAESRVSTLKNAGLALRPTTVRNDEELKAALDSESWDLFLARDNQADMNPFQAVKLVRRTKAELPVILISDHYSEDLRTKALQAGMQDALASDQNELLPLIVRRELEKITAIRGLEKSSRAQHEAEKRCQLLLDSSKDAIAYIHEGMHIYANDTYMELFGFESPDDLLCLPMVDVVAAEDQPVLKSQLKEHLSTGETQSFPIKGLKSDRSAFEAEMVLSPANYDEEECTQVLIRDNTDAEALKQKLKEISEYDLLTGLHNRHAFMQTLSGEKAEGTSAHVLYIDIDGFRELTEKYGITHCDALMRDVANWLRDRADDKDYLAHIGDSAYAILSPGHDAKSIVSATESMIADFSEEYFQIDKQSIRITLSVGICSLNLEDSNADASFANAHAACLSLKAEGGNSCKLYNPAIDSLLDQGEKDILEAYQAAVQSEGLALYYQPLMPMKGQQVQIYQAAARVRDEDGHWSLPANLLDALSKAGMAIEFDRQVIDLALTALKKEKQAGKSTQLLINLTSDSLVDDDLWDYIESKIAEYGISSNRLGFVLRETDAAGYLKRASQFFDTVREKGILTCLSHFTGSVESTSLLEHLDLDFVFTDGSLTEAMIKDPADQATLAKVIQQAGGDGKSVVVTWVSTAGALAQVWPMGSHFIQGFYIRAPAPDLEFDFQ